MEIRGIAREQLGYYTARQIENLFPLSPEGTREVLEFYVDEALLRLRACIDSVKMWRAGVFDVHHSSQYCSYLYLLSRVIWISTGQREIPTLLFLLNKALNSIDLFYEIELPKHFLIGHSVGIVLAKAVYGDYLVLYQNSTVGRSHIKAPSLGEGVILYPNTAVIGDCIVGANTTLAQGASLIDQGSPGDCVVFRGQRAAVIRPSSRRYIDDYFRL